jgi:glycosyltransferase involved in cell wall biosynthesis
MSSPMRAPPSRLGVFNDGPLTLVPSVDGIRISPDAADVPFFTFACEVGANFDSMLVFGRTREESTARDRQLLPRGTAVAELPYYDNLFRLDQVVRAIPGTIRGFWRGLSKVDVVWVFGPHPFAFLLVGLAALRRRRVVLGVRQDTVEYFRKRLPSRRWAPALLAVYGWEAGFRLLARAAKTTVVGTELVRRYGGERRSTLSMTVSLVRDADVRGEPAERDWTGPIELLTVGRIDQEKNPLLLVEALAVLERTHPGRYRLAWAGTGPLVGAVQRRARELGVDRRIDLLGFVPFRPDLLARYQTAHVFVHVSLTEGVPAVLVEALATGVPVVATAVGGVVAALDDGRAGLLVPPADVDALSDALARVVADAQLRRRITERGLELARGWTLDAQVARVARFIKDAPSPEITDSGL